MDPLVTFVFIYFIVVSVCCVLGCCRFKTQRHHTIQVVGYEPPKYEDISKSSLVKTPS